MQSSPSLQMPLEMHLGMHWGMMAAAIATAYTLRCLWPWVKPQRWQTTISLFALPPLLLLMTAIAIVIMGPRGQMLSPWEGWLTYGFAWAFLAAAGLQMSLLSWQAWLSHRQLLQYPLTTIQHSPGRIIPSEIAFSALIGLWQPQLVISQGLLDLLDEEHLTAVLAHEAAHRNYCDTRWCFWLGCLRRLTPWLPHSEALWQEILLMREIRADWQATQQVDRLILAEALVQVMAAPLGLDSALYANCSDPVTSRLDRRIDALLQIESAQPLNFYPHRWQWSEISLSLLPLLAIPFHS